MENLKTVIEKLVENQEAIIRELESKGIDVPKRTINNIDNLFEEKRSWW